VDREPRFGKLASDAIGAVGSNSMMKLMAALLTAMTFGLAASAHAQAQTGQIQSAWDHVARVVAIGDLHGDYAKFHDQLRQAGLIDARDAWSGGATHLVQLGDVPDRAPDTRKILDLLIRLEPQAKRAGGYVHALIGNHEAMNMEGDLRYTTPGEFAAFADADSARKRDAYYARVVAALKAQPREPGESPWVFDAAFRAQFDAEHPLGWVEHRLAWSAQGVYGRWIATHAAVIRIDDTLFLHGGIGPAFAGFDVDTLDKAVVAALQHQPDSPGGPQAILTNDQGPLWYRGMAQNDEAAEGPNVAAVLSHYGVRHIVFGHTKQYPMVNSRFDGAVILTDIAAPRACADPHGFLIKEGDKLTVVHRGQKLALGTAGAAHAAYLAQIAAIDAAAKPDCPAT
jgi:hypothetical protein